MNNKPEAILLALLANSEPVVNLLPPHERRFNALMEEWENLLVYCTDNGLAGTELAESILDHIEYYTERHDAGMYLPENAKILENTDNWLPFNDRHGLNSIAGSLNEYYAMVNLAKTGHTVIPAVSKHDQAKKQLDFTLMKGGWSGPVTCQSKSIVGVYGGKFWRKVKMVNDWLKIPVKRLYISDEMYTLWCDTVLLKETFKEHPEWVRGDSINTSLVEIYEAIHEENCRKFPTWYGLFKKR